MRLASKLRSKGSSLVFDSGDALFAVKQAEVMARVWLKDVAILPDLRVVKLEELKGGVRTPKILEIVRYKPKG